MKKLCFVAEYMFCGGTEKSMLSLMKCLDKNSYDITLLLLKKKGELISQLPDYVKVEEIVLPEDEKDDLLVGRTFALKESFQRGRIVQFIKKACRGIEIKIHTKSEAGRRLWYYEKIGNKIAEYPEKFDVVIDYMGYGLFNTYYAARKIQGKVKFSWVHFEPKQAMPDFDAFREVLDEYNYIMCVSENGRSQITSMMPELEDKCKVFYNIVDRNELLKLAKNEQIKKEKGKISILSIGRLDPQKGFDYAIDIVSRLYEEGFPVVWNIIGEGWQREELESIIAKNQAAQECVKLLGKKINPYPYIEACDIYFQPSRHEGYGIAVAEARAFDKPIIATDFAGAKEQLVNEKTGIIVKFDKEQIYFGLKRMIEDIEMRRKLSNNLRLEHETTNEQLKALENILDNA